MASHPVCKSHSQPDSAESIVLVGVALIERLRAFSCRWCVCTRREDPCSRGVASRLIPASASSSSESPRHHIRQDFDAKFDPPPDLPQTCSTLPPRAARISSQPLSTEPDFVAKSSEMRNLDLFVQKSCFRECGLPIGVVPPRTCDPGKITRGGYLAAPRGFGVGGA
jgi:hypothetical protein